MEERTLPSASLPLNPFTWTALGPAPINNGQTPGFQPVAGRVTGLALDPNNANTIYLTAAGGGVWKTMNHGTSWMPLTNQQSTLFMGAIAVAPSNSNIIYAGTGEANNSADSFYGRGILKSSDGGQTWMLLTGNTGQNEFDRRTVAKIVVDPNNADIVYAAISDKGANGLPGNTGVWKSIDGGQSWTDTTVGPDPASPTIPTNVAFSDLVIDPDKTKSNILFAAVGEPGGDAANGVYVTTDGGTTWNPAGNFLAQAGSGDGANLGRTTLAIAPSNDMVVYAVAAKPTSDQPTSGNLLGVFKSTDGGTTWNELTGMAIPDYLDNQGDYDSTLIVDPNNPDVIYVGGATSLDPNFTGSAIYRITMDAGTTTVTAVDDISGVLATVAQPDGPHADNHAIAFESNGNLVVGTDGGVWDLANPATVTPQNAVWTDLNSNLQITTFTGTALDPNSESIAYGGSQDTGTEKFNDSTTWTTVGTNDPTHEQTFQLGDGGFVHVDSTNSMRVYHTFPYQGINTPNFFQISTDGGATWTPNTNGINLNDPANFYPPVVTFTDSTAGQPDHVLLGTNNVYEYTVASDRWTSITAPDSGWTNTANVDSIVASPGGQVIYAAAGGQVWVTQNHGASWTEAGPLPNLVANANLKGITLDPSNPGFAFVVVANFSTEAGVGHVYSTSDFGKDWSDITGNLPNLPDWSVALIATSSLATDTLYVGTDAGVYQSSGNGQTWTPVGAGLPNVQVVSLEVHMYTSEEVLAAGTHGQGLWELSLTPTPVPITPPGNGKSPPPKGSPPPSPPPPPLPGLFSTEPGIFNGVPPVPPDDINPQIPEPPDDNVAAGPTELVGVVNFLGVRVFDKITSATLATTTWANLFAAVGPIAPFDPVVTYYEPAQRFVVVTVDVDAANQRSFLDIAVSKDSNATDGFNVIQQINVTQVNGIGANLWGDFPRLGWNADSIVVTLNMFTFGPGGGLDGTFDHVQVVAVDQASLLAGLPPVVNQFNMPAPPPAFGTTDFTLDPAVMHDSAAGDPMWFVEAAPPFLPNQQLNPFANLIDVVQIANILVAPVITDNLVAVPGYFATVPKTQPGGLLNPNYWRITCVSLRGNRLVASDTVGTAGGNDHARWYEFNLAGAAPVLAQSGEINSGPGFDTYFPSIEISVSGDLGLTYMESSATEGMSMYVTGQVAGDPAGAMRAPLLVAPGYNLPYTGTRSGDYSGIAVDPAKGDMFWAINEYKPIGPANSWAVTFQGFSLRLVTPLQVVDNLSPGFRAIGPNWALRNGGYLGTYRINTPGVGAELAQWFFLRPAGTYSLYTTWVPLATNANNATYDIFNGPNLLDSVPVDQTAAPGATIIGGVQWRYLGTYTLALPGVLWVELSDNANGNVVADAVFVADPPSSGSSTGVGSASQADRVRTGGGGHAVVLDQGPGLDLSLASALFGSLTATPVALPTSSPASLPPASIDALFTALGDDGSMPLGPPGKRGRSRAWSLV